MNPLKEVRDISNVMEAVRDSERHPGTQWGSQRAWLYYQSVGLEAGRGHKVYTINN